MTESAIELIKETCWTSRGRNEHSSFIKQRRRENFAVVTLHFSMARVRPRKSRFCTGREEGLAGSERAREGQRDEEREEHCGALVDGVGGVACYILKLHKIIPDTQGIRHYDVTIKWRGSEPCLTP